MLLYFRPCLIFLVPVPSGQLIDASTFKVSEDGSKQTERYILLFAHALVSLKLVRGTKTFQTGPNIRRLPMPAILFRSFASGAQAVKWWSSACA